MWKKMESYSLLWSAAEKAGTIQLKLEDGSRGRVRHLSRMELVAFGELFRNEENVWFHSTREDLCTGEKPDEEE